MNKKHAKMLIHKAKTEWLCNHVSAVEFTVVVGTSEIPLYISTENSIFGVKSSKTPLLVIMWSLVLLRALISRACHSPAQPKISKALLHQKMLDFSWRTNTSTNNKQQSYTNKQTEAYVIKLKCRSERERKRARLYSVT